MTNLEGGSAPRARPDQGGAGGKTMRWGVLGIGVLAMLGTAAAWLSSENRDARMLAGVTTHASVPNSKVLVATEAEMATPVAAATIRDEGAAAPNASFAAPGRDNKPAQSLKEMLGDSIEPAAKSHGNVISTALERPSPAPAKTHEAVQTRLEGGKLEVAAKAVKSVLVKEKLDSKPAKPKSREEPDSDVILLAALMAHAQVRPVEKKASSLRTQLKQCTQMNEPDAEQCRLNVCSARRKTDAQCRALE